MDDIPFSLGPKDLSGGCGGKRWPGGGAYLSSGFLVCPSGFAGEAIAQWKDGGTAAFGRQVPEAFPGWFNLYANNEKCSKRNTKSLVFLKLPENKLQKCATISL